MASQTEEAAAEQLGSKVAHVRASLVTEISRKLKHLLDAFNLKELDLIRDLSVGGELPATGATPGSAGSNTKKKRNRELIGARTVRGWLSDKRSERYIYPYAQDRIIRFFESRVPGLKLSNDLLQCSWDEYIFRVDPIAEKLSKQVVLPLAGPPIELEDEIIRYLVGKYKIFRLSYADTSEVVSEVGLITQAGSSRKVLNIEIYSPPADTGRKVRALSDAERFRGVLFQFGDMFYATVSFSAGDSSRVRYYHFPKLGNSRWAHYGISSGYSSNLKEPVATKALAIKMRDPSVETSNIDLNLIDRYAISDDKMKSVWPLIDNHIDMDGECLLSVRQAKVLPLLSRLKDPK